MEPSLLVVDDFFLEPEAVRRAALAQSFATREYEGVPYQGIGTDFKPDADPLVVARLRRAFGFPVRPELSFWRLGLAGDSTTTWIHFDSGCAPWAALVYLSPEPEGQEAGTAFWRHRELGWDEAPRSLTGDVRALAECLDRDGMDAAAWWRTDFVALKMNRLIIYPSRRFHSRYPQDAWGADAETGRLVWVCFFDRG